MQNLQKISRGDSNLKLNDIVSENDSIDPTWANVSTTCHILLTSIFSLSLMQDCSSSL